MNKYPSEEELQKSCRYLPSSYLMGKIGSHGWSTCDACGDVEEPVFPHTICDQGGLRTDYYCRHCYLIIVGRAVETNNRYLFSGNGFVIATINDARKKRTRRRKAVSQIWASDKTCPTCHGTGKVKGGAGNDPPGT